MLQDCVHVLAYIRSNEGFSKDEAPREAPEIQTQA